MSNLYNVINQKLTLPVSGIELPNRLVMAPMTTFSGNPDGTVSDAELKYYGRRAASVGMLVTACAYVIPHGKGFYGQIGAHDDAMVPGLKKIADAVHAKGAKAVLQIYHGGRMCPPAEVPGQQLLSASDVPASHGNLPAPRAMTEQEILETIDAFGQATRRAVEAGFDGVEIHGANTYLLQQFFSPHSNRRNDQWGGSLENRMAFPLAVVTEVTDKAAEAGRPFIVGYRISPEEIENPGIEIDDTLAFVELLAAQKLDYLHVSTMDFNAGSLRDAQDKRSRTMMIYEKVGQKLPVIGVGGLHTAQDVASVLEKGVHLVALGRELLMEPEWLQKVKDDKELRTTLSVSAQHELDIPDPMWQALLSRKGWLPVID
jgi:2,4-dienoyl-CoA reductase-like NADH-dependent reductase (Old Yellow Enzyme family)